MATSVPLPHCSVCKRTLKYGSHAPFLMPCLHTVCSDCLNQRGTILTCTYCNETHNKPDHIFLKDAVASAAIVTSTAQNNPSAIKCTNKKHDVTAEIWCRDCQVFYCMSCLASHNHMKTAQTHDMVRVKALSKGESLNHTSKCPEHEGYPLDLYDTTCEILVCSKCTRGEHKQCTCEDIEGFTLESAKQALKDNKNQAEERLKEVSSASQLLTTGISETKDRREVMNTKLKGRFESIRKLLDAREQELINKLDSSGCSLLEPISQQLDIQRKRLEAVRDYTSRLSTHGDGTELLTLTPSVGWRTDECLAETIPAFQIPRVQVSFDEEQMNELTSLVSALGSVGTEVVGRRRKKRSHYENVEIKPASDKSEETDSKVVVSPKSVCESSEDESQCGEYNISEDNNSEAQSETSESYVHL